MPTKKEIDLEKQELLRDYRECFTTPAGRKVIADLVRRCGIMTNTFDPINESMNTYHSGRKSICFEILELLDYATIEGYYEFRKQQIEQAKSKSIVGTYFK
jgi:hypothetical protein